MSQSTRGSDKGATRAQPGDEVRDPAIRLIQQFDGGRLVMRAPIGRIVVLVRIKVPIGIAGEQSARFQNGAVAAFHRIRQNQFGAVNLEQPLALGGDVRRHAEPDPDAARGAEHRV